MYTVVIPSKDLIKAAKCVQAIYRAGEEPRIIVVDDSNDGTKYVGIDPTAPVTFIEGIQPFIYARNCNLGIKAAGQDDVILMNDDALLVSPNGFAHMNEWSKPSDIGLIGCVCNSIGNPYQYQRWSHDTKSFVHSEDRALAFVCVYIPRRTIDTVGLLDERYTAYGWEDTDYCRRVVRAGLKLGIAGDCFVDHLSLKSSFRGEGGVSGDIEPGRRIYIDKWGDDGL